MPITPWITQSELAKQLGVSRAAVCLAIKSGRVTALNGKLVHSTTAAQQFLEGSKRQHTGASVPTLPPPAEQAAHSDPLLVDTTEDPLTSLAWGTQTAKPETEKAAKLAAKTPEAELPSLQQSRLRREHYQAELSKLQLAQQRRELVPASQVKKEAFQLGRSIREALANLADRLAHQLAGETDPQVIHEMLSTEHRAALVELAEG